MIGEQLSLAKANENEKANHILEKVIRYFEKNPELLATEGLFRLSGNSTEVNAVYQKYASDYSKLDFETEENFQQTAATPLHNIVSFLKRFMKTENDVGWSDEAAEILHKEIIRAYNAENEEQRQFNFNDVITKLIADNHLEEAKMLHNVLYLSQLVAIEQSKASTILQEKVMTPQKIFTIIGPWLQSMAKINDPSLMLKMAGPPSKNALDIGTEKSLYNQSFDTKHPQAAEDVWQNRVKIPLRNSKPAVTDSTNEMTTVKKPSWVDRFVAYIKPATDWVIKTAYPTVKNAINKWLTKTLPSLFKRLTGSKAKEPVSDKMAIPPELLAAKQQADAARAEAAKAKQWQSGQEHKAERDSAVIMGYNRPPNLGEPHLPPDPSEPPPPASVSPRASILTPDEAEGAKQAREEGLKHFQELESKATPQRPPVPPRKILTPVESEAAIQARKEGLKHFQELEAKGKIPPRPEVPPRKRPIVSPGGERPVVPPRSVGPAVSSGEKKERPLPIPPSKDNKPKG